MSETRPYPPCVVGEPLLVSFVGGAVGQWRVDAIRAVRGAALAPVERVAVIEGRDGVDETGARWILHGSTSNERYVGRAEQTALRAIQPPLGRPEATRAALIPVRKSAVWWDMPQDERLTIFGRSQHVALGLFYLPAIARRLHHGRELGEPFDFLTWFEYAPRDAAAFEELTERLRATEEWGYVEREVDVRLSR